MNDKIARVGNWVLFAVSLPNVLTGWGAVLLACALFLAHKIKLGPYGVLTAQWRPWWVKRWRYSTTFGRGIIFQPSVADGRPDIIDNQVEKHEMVHVRQMEDVSLLSLLVSVVVLIVSGNWILALSLWMTSTLWLVPNFLSAVLRGGHVYRDTEHERSAYAQCSRDAQGATWLDRHLSKPREW